jgi:hypothetical protein
MILLTVSLVQYTKQFKGKKMKRLLLVFIMMATWMVVGCESTLGCFGHWVKGPGPQRGTRELNRDAHLPYYQCVDENNKGNNLEERRYL